MTLWHRFLAWTGLSPGLVCDLSCGMGTIDYHRRQDSLTPARDDHHAHTCMRCGKGFHP